MATEVRGIFLIHFINNLNLTLNLRIPTKRLMFIGNEVAEYVRDHLITELKKLQSFKQGDYE
jgi:hypothetical protein